MNIIDTLKRAAEALERAAAVVIMERDSSEFEREAKTLRAAITEIESAELPEPRLSDFFFSANPEPTNYYTRDQMLAFRAGADKPWRDAVENELIVAHILNESHEDPRKAVQDAISWNVQVALDPAVSSDAQALIELGRDSAADPMDKVAQKFAHRLAMNLECLILECPASSRFYDESVATLSEYRSAMNSIHERESPTFMGEPVL